MRIAKVLVLLAVVVVQLAGCGWRKLSHDQPEYQTVAVDPRRDTELACRLNAQAVQLIRDGCLPQAEKVLKDALSADLFHGPAHNNLGLVYFHQENYYLAAWEFQYAIKTMPTKAEPRNNLGMVFEAVGKQREAADHYDQALALDPDNHEIIGNLARIRVGNNKKDEHTRQLLTDLVLKDPRPDWNMWARERLALMGATVPATTSQPDAR